MLGEIQSAVRNLINQEKVTLCMLWGMSEVLEFLETEVGMAP